MKLTVLHIVDDDRPLCNFAQLPPERWPEGHRSIPITMVDYQVLRDSCRNLASLPAEQYTGDLAMQNLVRSMRLIADEHKVWTEEMCGRCAFRHKMREARQRLGNPRDN